MRGDMKRNLICFLLLFYFNLFNADLFCSKANNTDSRFIQQLYHMIKCISDTLQQRHITHWWIGGTLLGAVRHAGIIPWDTDADCCMFVEDANLLPEINREMQKFGYLIIQKTWNRFKILPKKDLQMLGVIKDVNEILPILSVSIVDCDKIMNSIVKQKRPYIDIYLSVKHGDKISHRVNPTDPIYFLVDELFPLKKYRFGEMNDLLGPNNPHGYLERAYGKNYMTHGQNGKPLNEIFINWFPVIF